MEIVVTNDDGWGTKGIRTLVAEMSKLGHVTVIAPDGPRSGNAACISVAKPMFINKLENECTESVDVYTTNGTPADCIKFATNIVFKNRKIDLVASGINHGNNGSINLIYSGTMGACFVATEHGIPAIGFSMDDHSMDADFSRMQPYLTEIVKMLIAKGFKPNECYNVNAPKGEIAGIKWARQCHGHWADELEAHTDEQGNTYYTLIGSYINHEPDDETTDIWAIGHGYISIQPVSIDMTAHGSL